MQKSNFQKTALVVSAIFIAFQAQAATGGKAAASCERLNEVYLRCTDRSAPPFRYDGRDFHLRIQNRLESVPCTDGVKRGFYDRLHSMDIASILEIPYTAGPMDLPGQTDPGRLRNESFLKAMYGTTSAEVIGNLRTVRFLDETVTFNRKNGAALALEEVGREIKQLVSADPEFAAQLAGWRVGNTFKRVSRGTFTWRPIAGTTLLSTHSFGTAIDLAPLPPPLPEYWRWMPSANRGSEEQVGDFAPPAEISSFPWKLVEIFERHGFIWGGKWRHFDSMHFEYRPEFIQDFQQNCER